jgi:DNA-binding NarL/FixJ family response regulator
MEQVVRSFTPERETLAREGIESLTSREHEVLRLISFGNTTKMIAGDLEISPRTVEIYRARAIQKLGARNTADAVRILSYMGLARMHA